MGLFGRLLPLALLFIFVGVLAVVGVVVYSIVSEVKQQTKEKLQKNNVNWSKDGVTVEMKHVEDEEYKDRTQRHASC